MRTATAALLGVGLVLSDGAGALAEPQSLSGDRDNGASLFRVQCAACHGIDGRGNGSLAAKLPVAVGNLRDPAYLATRSDDELKAAIVKGVRRQGKPQAMPGARWLSVLELADLLAFLRDGQLKVTDFFPTAQYFTARTYALDQGAQDRVQKLTGHPLAAGDASVTVVTVYGEGHPEGPEVVPDDPVALDKLEPKEGKGYLIFAALPHPKAGSQVTGIALARNGEVRQVKSQAGLANSAEDKDYQAYVGLGKKGEAALLKPKGKGGPTAAEDRAFNDAWARAREAVLFADREEKDRHWADTK